MIIYFDTETTGLRPGQICQLSYIMQGENTVSAKNFFFTVSQMDASAQAVHGFSAAMLYMLSNGRRFADFAEEIAADFAAADLLVAHNVGFDLSFLRAEFERCEQSFRYNESMCSMKKFTPICKLMRSDGVRYKYPKLSELCEFLELYPYDVSRATIELFGGMYGSHDARYDTAALYLAMNNARPKYGDINTCFEVYL